jgi:C4-type Zn-finger protein
MKLKCDNCGYEDIFENFNIDREMIEYLDERRRIICPECQQELELK